MSPPPTPPDGTPPVLLTMTVREFAVCDDGPIGMWRDEVCALSAALAEARQEIARMRKTLNGNATTAVLENERANAAEARLAQVQADHALMRGTLETLSHHSSLSASIVVALLARAREGR